MPPNSTLLGSYEYACTDMKFYGSVAHKNDSAQLDKIPMEVEWRVELHLGSKGFFTTIFMNLEEGDKIFEGGEHIFPHLSGAVHAAMEGKLLPRERKF
jgi:hypothetical protein